MQTVTMSNKEITKASYQATANEFARNVADLVPMVSIEKFIKLLPPKAIIIDLGCGSGRDAKVFTNMGIDVLGIDFCSNLIDIAETHAPLAKFELMDIEKIDLPNDSFDGVWAACSLGHIPKKELSNVLQQIHRILREDGYFYLALKKGSGEILEKDSRYDGDHKKFWSYYEEDELKNILQLAQFKILDFKLIEKVHSYHTHDAFRIFCRKS